MHVMMISWLPGATVPPIGYGGIERVVYTLSKELVRQGHQVTLVAPLGSSVEGATHILTDQFDDAYHWLEELQPDIVHSHECWSLDSVVRRRLSVPFLSTTHVMHAVGWTKHVVYLSESQRASHYSQMGRSMLGNVPVIRVPTSPLLKPKGLSRSGDLLYLGSVVEHKGVHRAAEVAAALGRHLTVAGPAAGPYADRLAALPYVTLLGEVRDPERSELIERAWAMMCLHGGSGWVEPGCGVVGEAGAFGTPVAALSNGCLPEIVIQGENGWIADNTSSLIDCMECDPYPAHPGRLAHTEWSAECITQEYVQLYQEVIEGRVWE